MKAPPDITVTSGVSAKTGEGFVVLRWGELACQLTPDEARRHALGVIQCADASEFDQAFVKAIGGPDGHRDEKAVQLLAMIRNVRGNESHSFRATFDPEPLE